MGFAVALKSSQKSFDAPLAYLPCSTIAEYRKGQIIYGPERPSSSLHLLLAGKVEISSATREGHNVAIDVYQVNDFFGESGFVDLGDCCEQATALENTLAMAWNIPEVEHLLLQHPKLGTALQQILVRRILELRARLESFAVDNLSRRLARTLIRFSERSDVSQDDGAVHMPPITHDLLAQLVGTNRVQVTHAMTQFRTGGYLRYSRKGISLYRSALQEWLRASRRTPDAL